MARTCTVTLQQRATVLESLEQGASLRTAAAAASLGSEAAIRRLTANDPVFATQYAHARDIALDRMADEVIAIADDQTLDPNSRRVMMDARRWYLSKLAPKRYGERIEVNVGITHDARQIPTAELERLVLQQRDTLQLAEDGTVEDQGGVGGNCCEGGGIEVGPY